MSPEILEFFAIHLREAHRLADDESVVSLLDSLQNYLDKRLHKHLEGSP